MEAIKLIKSIHNLELNCKHTYIIQACQSSKHVMIHKNVDIINSTYHVNMHNIPAKSIGLMVKVVWTFKNGVEGAVLISSTS